MSDVSDIHVTKTEDEIDALLNWIEEAKESMVMPIVVENAVEKLKALKRLKSNGFKFDGWKRDDRFHGDYTITASDEFSCYDEDLELLFGSKN